MQGTPYDRGMKPPLITFSDALAAFGRPADMARAFEVSRASVAEWKKRGVLPPLRAMQLRELRPERFAEPPQLPET